MTTRSIKELDVLVVGAGIGGLTTAMELHRMGICCHIVEATKQFRSVGVGINILPHASKQLGELGMEAALSRFAVLTEESAFFNRFGQFIYSEPAGRAAGYRDPQYSIHRADLYNALRDAVVERLGAESIRLGCRVVSTRENSSGITAHAILADGTECDIESDVVIAADGIHSALRAQLFPAEGPPRYSGVMMWRGVTVMPPFLSGATMVRAGWLAGGKLVIYPIRCEADGTGNQLVNWAAEAEMPQRPGRDWNKQGQLEDFLPYFADWHFDWLDVPRMLETADIILEYPMVDQDPLPRWSHGRLTLLGDAGHPMVPRGSNGAGQSILDARVLAECLAAEPCDPIGALAAYDDRRRAETTAVVLANRSNPPDAILREVFERTGDRPFDRLEDVVSVDVLKEIAENYKRISHSTLADLHGSVGVAVSNGAPS